MFNPPPKKNYKEREKNKIFQNQINIWYILNGTVRSINWYWLVTMPLTMFWMRSDASSLSHSSGDRAAT